MSAVAQPLEPTLSVTTHPPAPRVLGAIDAGSNAVRLMVARANSADEFERLETSRIAVRLGEGVFTEHAFPARTMTRAVKAFVRFRRIMDRHGVDRYRAVATSATRHARNRREFLSRVLEESGIHLEVIDSREEARLVRTAVLGSLGPGVDLGFIGDLGGGSLEVSLLRNGHLERGVALSVGTVRMLETFDADGVLSRRKLREIALHVKSTLRSSFPERPTLDGRPAAACGGNAECLARLAGADPVHGLPTLDMARLRRLLPRINSLSIPARMETFGVKKDRAEVMGLAALVLLEMARWFGIERFVVPGVGVRNGIIRDLSRRHFGSVGGAKDGRSARALLAAATRLGRRFRCDGNHAAQVRRLSLSLFDQLQEVHGLGPESRLALGLGAELHELGRSVADHDHPVHGAYLVRHAEVPGLDPPLRDIVASLVRYQRGRIPELTKDDFGDLLPERRREVRTLAGMLRVAHGMDTCHHGAVEEVRARLTPERIVLQVKAARETREVLERAGAAGDLLRRETGREVVFRALRAAN